MTYRLVHIADVHLDASYARAGLSKGFGNRRRQELRDVVQRILQDSASWPADAVLIAGDLFDLDRISADTAAFLHTVFAAVDPLPILIAAGNHDPASLASPYIRESWPSNVFIFSKPEWESVSLYNGGLIVHGFGFDGPDLTTNPFANLVIEQDKAVHVAVAHGSERGHQPEGKLSYAPFYGDEVADPNLRYLALGHIHIQQEIAGEMPTTMYYSGPPQGHDFSETGPRGYLRIELGPKKTTVTPIISSLSCYETWSIDCASMDSAQDAVEAIRVLEPTGPGRRIARITLTGTVSPELHSGLLRIKDTFDDVFELLELVDQTVSAEDYDHLAQGSTSLGDFTRRMNGEIERAQDVAQRQLLERAREVGVASFRQREVPVLGMEGDI